MAKIYVSRKLYKRAPKGIVQGKTARKYIASRPHMGAKPLINKTSRFQVGTRLTSNVINSPIPLMKSVKLRYAETFTLTTGTAGVLGTAQYFKLNSAYDPNGTGGGHQPYYFDTYSAQYASYRVNATKIELIWSTIGGSADVCAAYMVSSPYAFLTIGGETIDRVTEMDTVGTHPVSASGNNRCVKDTFIVNHARILGVSKKKYQSDDKYSALCSADPTVTTQLQLAAGSYAGVASENVSVQVVLTQYLTFFDRKYQSQS